MNSWVNDLCMEEIPLHVRTDGRSSGPHSPVANITPYCCSDPSWYVSTSPYWCAITASASQGQFPRYHAEPGVDDVSNARDVLNRSSPACSVFAVASRTGSVVHDTTPNRAASVSPVHAVTQTDLPHHAVSSPWPQHTSPIQPVASRLTTSYIAPLNPPIPEASLPAPLPQPVPRETFRPNKRPPDAGRDTVTEAQTTRIVNAEALQIGYSTTKYVDRDCFMGRHSAYLQCTSTKQTSLQSPEWTKISDYMAGDRSLLWGSTPGVGTKTRVSSSGGSVSGDHGARPLWRNQGNDYSNCVLY